MSEDWETALGVLQLRLEQHVARFFRVQNQRTENEVRIFQSAQFGDIRTAGTSEQPLFCLADVCKACGIKNFRVNERLAKDVISNQPLETAGGTQQALFVNEDGLYDVILDSRKKSARQFRKWVTSEVLPSIRKSGGYIAAKQDETPEEIMARALQVANDTLARRDERIRQQEAQIELQTTTIKEQAPKVAYYDSVLQSVNTLTATQVAKQIGMDASKLNKKLREAGMIYRQSGQWLLRSPYCSWGLHSIRTQAFTRQDGGVGSSTYTVWTQKGCRFIHALSQCEWDIRKTIKMINN